MSPEERAKLRQAERDAHVKALVDRAPLVTPEQARQLRLILRPPRRDTP